MDSEKCESGNQSISHEKVTTTQATQTKHTIHHFIVFILTFVSYLQLTAMRKSISYLKSHLIQTWLPENPDDPNLSSDFNVWNAHSVFTNRANAEIFLGTLDAIFMFTYAIGNYISGMLGDRIEPRIVLCAGMCCTALTNMAFGVVTEWAHFYSVPFYIFLWVLNGFFQSACWPTAVNIVGKWFGRAHRGLILGFWSTNACCGNIVGAYLCASTLSYGYEYSFMAVLSLLLALGFIVAFGVVSTPQEIGLDNTDSQLQIGTDQSQIAKDIEATKQQPIGFFRALMLPGVLAYALAFTCLKAVTYGVFFWLPYYMHEQFEWSDEKAAQISTFFDWGGIVGSIVGGLISDFLGKRSPVISAQLGMAIIFLGLYTRSPNNVIINAALVSVVGFFVSGSTNLVSSAVAADLARQEAVKKNAKALSTVSGIIEGSGSAGAALMQVAIPFLGVAMGWNSIFYMFMVMLFVSLVMLSKLCYRECKELKHAFMGKLYRLSGGIGHVDYATVGLDLEAFTKSEDKKPSCN